MAETKSTAGQAGTPSKSIADDACRISTKAEQLASMLLMTHGQAEETFSAMSLQSRDAYMSACHALAVECKTLADAIESQALAVKAAASSVLGNAA